MASRSITTFGWYQINPIGIVTTKMCKQLLQIYNQVAPRATRGNQSHKHVFPVTGGGSVAAFGQPRYVLDAL